jgi:hypothetical protein
VQHVNDDEWFLWFGNIDNRRVALTTVGSQILVSTVFIGIDRSYGQAARPQIFETVVRGGEYDRQEFYSSTWSEAAQRHQEVVTMVKRAE